MRTLLCCRNISHSKSERSNDNERDKELEISNYDIDGIYSQQVGSNGRLERPPNDEKSQYQRCVSNHHRKIRSRKIDQKSNLLFH